MKVVVSYISSLYDQITTIDKINQTSADGIHADLMDGKYVEEKNFDIDTLSQYFINNHKPIEFHLMVNNPEQYLEKLYIYQPSCIYIHPSTSNNPKDILKDIKMHNIEPAIVINPDEEIDKYLDLFPLINRVLLMSVIPGKGGQTFIEDTIDRLNELINYKKQYNFSIYIDGGINKDTINKVKSADGVVSGSYICKSNDYQSATDSLKQ